MFRHYLQERLLMSRASTLRRQGLHAHSPGVPSDLPPLPPDREPPDIIILPPKFPPPEPPEELPPSMPPPPPRPDPQRAPPRIAADSKKISGFPGTAVLVVPRLKEFSRWRVQLNA